jgi:hypothetical protein
MVEEVGNLASTAVQGLELRAMGLSCALKLGGD